MFEQDDVVEIVDDSYIAFGHPSLSKYYKNGMFTTLGRNRGRIKYYCTIKNRRQQV